jgi:hypothetical protein
MAEPIMIAVDHLPNGGAGLAIGDGSLTSLGADNGNTPQITTSGSFPGRKVISHISQTTHGLVIPVVHATQLVFGQRVRFASGSSGVLDVVKFVDASANVMVSLRVDATDSFTVRGNGVSLGSVSIPVNTVIYLEVATYMATTAVGYVLVRIDGVEVFREEAVVTKGGGHGDCSAIRLAGTVLQTTLCTDIYVKEGDTDPDAAGLFYGPVQMVILRGDSDITENWTPDTGSSNVARVNEDESDSGTSYIETGVAGTKDEHGLEDLPGTVTALVAMVAVAVSVAPAGGAPQILLGLKNGSGEVVAAAATVGTTSYRTQSRAITQRPGGGGWTPGTAPTSYTIEAA